MQCIICNGLIIIWRIVLGNVRSPSVAFAPRKQRTRMVLCLESRLSVCLSVMDSLDVVCHYANSEMPIIDRSSCQIVRLSVRLPVQHPLMRTRHDNFVRGTAEDGPFEEKQFRIRDIKDTAQILPKHDSNFYST